MKTRKGEIKLRNAYEASPLRIIADAAVSVRGLAGGRLIPLVILDTSTRQDVEEYIRLHGSFKAGDVRLQWGQIEGHGGTVALFLTVIRPSELTIVLEFDIVKQGILVDQALRGQGLYIQAGRDGDCLIKDPDRPKVLLDVGELGFGEIWEQLFHKHVEKHFRAIGLSRAESRRAANQAIAEMRRIGSMRLRDLTE